MNDTALDSVSHQFLHGLMRLQRSQRGQSYDQLDLNYAGDLLTDILTPREREDIRWYLEEYAEWPYEQFFERGKKIEATLPQFGKRLYWAVRASPKAMGVVQALHLQLGGGGDYRRQKKESYAAFAGHRLQIERLFVGLIALIVVAAQGDAQARATVEVALPQAEQSGWHISEVVQRIWQELTERLDRQVTLWVLRMLETLTSSTDTPPSYDVKQTTEE